MTLRNWLAVCAMVLLPATIFAQPPRGGDMGGRSGRGGMFGDPSQWLDRIFAGKDSIDLNELQEPMRSGIQRFAQMMGITGDRITRQQMEEGSKQMRERIASGGGMPGMPGGTTFTVRSGDDSRGGDRGDRSRSDRDRERGDRMGESDAYAESVFRRSDRDNDGVLTADEMSDALRDERDKWDLNRDGFVELSEYKLFFAARMQQNMQDMRDFRAERRDGQDQEEPERKPVVFRAGKLPKELPTWFAQLDVNSDAQVGLYEWRPSSKPISEFKQYDRNGDNFLTVEEVLLYVKLNKPSGGDSFASANGSGDRRNFTMPGAPPFGANSERTSGPGSERTPGGSFDWRSRMGNMPGVPGMTGSPRGTDGGSTFPKMPFSRDRGDRSAEKSEKRDEKDAKREEDRPGMPQFGGKRKRN